MAAERDSKWDIRQLGSGWVVYEIHPVYGLCWPAFFSTEEECVSYVGRQSHGAVKAQ